MSTVPPTGSPGRPPDPREERFRPMGEFLTAELLAVVVLCVVALVAPGEVAGSAAAGLLALLVAIPLVRVAWLVVRWFRRGDPRFAAVGLFVLGVAALGWLLSR